MCTAENHVFIYTAATTKDPLPIGHRCLCGQERWGTAAELRALDETARLEAWLALPFPTPKGATR